MYLLVQEEDSFPPSGKILSVTQKGTQDSFFPPLLSYHKVAWDKNLSSTLSDICLTVA